MSGAAWIPAAAVLALTLASPEAEARPCGDKGVWLQVLGSGGAALEDEHAVASYLVWVDGSARLLVDAGSGSALRFGEAGAAVADLDAIVFTTLQARTTVDFPAFLEDLRSRSRDRRLPVFAPVSAAESEDGPPVFFDRMGALYGPFPSVRNWRVRAVPAFGNRRWAAFRSENIALAAMPVHHGGVPALAWRVAAGGRSLVFAGGFSNQRDVMRTFAENADALVAHHAIPENARGELLQRYAKPSKLGRVAAQATARMLILGHRTERTRGRETVSAAAIEAHFDGAVLFANDLECWRM